MADSSSRRRRSVAHPAEVSLSGIPGLDNVMAGGYPKGHLFLVEGDPGTGKTTLALQFLLQGLKQGERGLYITLSETAAELAGVARSHGWSLDGIELFELMPDEEALRPDAQYTVFHPSEVELTTTTQAIFEAVDRFKPTRVVVDSLSEMRLLSRESLRYRRQILGFKHFFAQHGATVLLLDDRSAEDGDIQLRSLAHGVLLLEQLALDFGAERRKLRVVKMRGVRYRGGYHDYIIRTGGIEVFPRLIAAEHHKPFERSNVESGLTELDALLGGGLDRGTSAMIMGPAGSGKTILSTQYACAAAERGDHVAFLLFDERLATFVDRAVRLGMPLQKHVRNEKILLRQIDPAEVSPGEFAHTIVSEVERHNTQLVVIDSLNGYISAMPEERLLDVRLHELLSYLAQRGVTTLLTLAQHGMFASVQGSQAEVSYLADSLIMLRFFEAFGEVRNAMSVLKKRSGHHEHTIREFQVTNHGVRVGEPLREFQGVLTGVPDYIGEKQPLLPHGGSFVGGQ
ncbi:MAG TPA: ATPase domain-containing protein [Gemmatimonadales bacterium]|nr:ATPase domain-containing protein [Gemmatimonadales bacterium]